MQSPHLPLAEKEDRRACTHSASSSDSPWRYSRARWRTPRTARGSGRAGLSRGDCLRWRLRRQAPRPTDPVGSSFRRFRGLNENHLADDLLFESDGAGAARGTFDAVAELADVNLQFGDRTAEGVAVHAQFASGAALVALVFLQDGQDETLLKFTHAFGIKNVAAIHLQDKCFELI